MIKGTTHTCLVVPGLFDFAPTPLKSNIDALTFEKAAGGTDETNQTEKGLEKAERGSMDDDATGRDA